MSPSANMITTTSLESKMTLWKMYSVLSQNPSRFGKGKANGWYIELHNLVKVSKVEYIMTVVCDVLRYTEDFIVLRLS